MDKIIQLLIEKGYEPAGETLRESFSVVVKESYPLAGSIVRLGGRQRFQLPGTEKRVTVGKRTVCVYQVVQKTPQAFQNFRTSDIEGIDKAT